jgi:hypothetical protein
MRIPELTSQVIPTTSLETPLPADAAAVYRHAIPDAAACNTGRHAWYGRNATGVFYRYQGRDTVHWSGTVRWQGLPVYVKLRFIELGIRR